MKSTTWALALLLGLMAPWATAQEVGLSGLAQGRALLSISGEQPRFVAPGQTYQGVKLISVGLDHAMVEVQGQRLTLRLGQAPLALDPQAPTTRRIVLVADSGGHFTSQGQINGRPVEFMVDTGSTALVLSETQARHIGLTFNQGTPVQVKTANGEITGHQLQLMTVRLGNAVSHNVAAVVLPTDLPYVLLGNSFLSRFRMQRENDRMVLEQRY